VRIAGFVPRGLRSCVKEFDNTLVCRACKVEIRASEGCRFCTAQIEVIVVKEIDNALFLPGFHG
jgi:hypothetical protein